MKWKTDRLRGSREMTEERKYSQWSIVISKRLNNHVIWISVWKGKEGGVYKIFTKLMAKNVLSLPTKRHSNRFKKLRVSQTR